MANKEWYSVSEASVLVGLKEGTVRKRVQRLAADEGGNELVRRSVPVDEGGRARFELHRDLVEQWRAPAVAATPSGRHDESRPETDVLREHLDYATQTARGYEIELHAAQLALRDKELETLQSRLSQAEQLLVEKDFELAEQRDELGRLGQLIADIYN